MPIRIQERLFRKALTRLLILPGGLILIATCLLALLVFNLMGVIEAGQRSSVILSKTRAAEKLIIDMETGLRGYLLNRDAIFLTPYENAVSKVSPLLDNLEKLSAGNPTQLRHIRTIRVNWVTWMTYGQTQFQRTPAQPPKDEAMGEKEAMDTIRAEFDAFERVEEGVLTQRTEEVRRTKYRMIYVGGSIALVLSILMTAYAVAELRHLTSDHRTALVEAHLRNTELHEQKEWFRITLSSIGDAVIVTDRTGAVTFMNPEAERMTGWTAAEALGKPLRSVFLLINEQTRESVEDPVEIVMRENRTTALETHTLLVARNGAEWPIEDSAAPIHGQKQEVSGAVLVFHDVSTQREAHRNLKEYTADLSRKVDERTQSLRRAVEEMEAFSYTVSHDLRSPLRAMQGYAQALMEDYSHKLDEQGNLYLTRINNAAQRLDKLIQDILAYTRLARDREEVVSVPLDKLVRDIVAQYPQFHAPRARIEIEGTLLPVLGREAVLTQVFSNLFDNAIKFVSPGLHPHIRVWTEEINGKIRIHVRDNGIGIARENQERIFKIFEQVHNPKQYGGTGIGLAIVKRAVENLGGNMGLESQLREGSLFWIDLRKG
ncbi:PAS domain S-box-containing protein [Verrucomicrobium sp. GAS474]|uniref:sensor histidine kinase n=1 Tax=Verrucomicrobium sp. GAS474 TaxID=1882831 RepID=UPI00087A1A98|nr:sensor histidine kinase [Verrucomicrobium sp. GAS474]SDU13187.1 PAS domain S-box-containing protein [Verrucomicrobium sp. GAS474]